MATVTRLTRVGEEKIKATLEQLKDLIRHLIAKRCGENATVQFSLSEIVEVLKNKNTKEFALDFKIITVVASETEVEEVFQSFVRDDSIKMSFNSPMLTVKNYWQ